VAGFGRSLPDERHAALPGVQQELAALAALPGAQVTALQDAAFTAQALQASLAGKPDVVHLASHFVLAPAGEEASYLLLGDSQRLSLRALRELPWQGVKLALLSACDTGIATASGAEWAGFADALHAAGVGQILASLWRVDDASTARWMRAFYAPAGSTGRTRRAPVWSPQHLAATQRQWLRSHAGSPWAHPHHWAAFQWLGAQS
jgi:CHAT domain-containing protein